MHSLEKYYCNELITILLSPDNELPKIKSIKKFY